MQSADGRALPAALPGQYVVVRLRPSADGRPLYRSYSLSGAGSTERYRISVKVEPNGAAGQYLRDHVATGGALDVSAPRGSFILQSGTDPVVLLSAGIGATPVLAMLHALAESGAESGGGRRDPAGRLAARRPRSGASPLRRRGAAPDGHAPARARLRLLQQARRARQGGRGFRRRRTPVAVDLRRGRRPARRRRLPLRADPVHGRDEGGAGRLRRGAPPDSPGALQRQRVDHPGRRRYRRCVGRRAPRAAPVPRRTPTPVRWCRSPAAESRRTGTRLSYQSILELAEACDVPVRWSCRTGVCHTCESGLVSGAVDYDPQPLDSPAKGNLLVCCSRPTRDVVIDL